jgi:hypothetical protein
VTLLALPFVACVAGCGGGAAQGEARAASDAFVAEAGDDPAAACEQLAPETRRTLEEDSGSTCPDAIGALDLTAAGDALAVTVAGHSAQVRYAGDTVFLAFFDDGWRVTAAGCERVSGDPSEPYDCDVEGA